MKRLLITAAITIAMGVASTASTPVELPLPVVPDSITDSSRRTDYLITHFYDSLDFNSPLALDTPSVEQNLVNFVALFPQASSPEVVDKAVADLLSRAAVSNARDLLLLSAEKYLYDIESPMTNEQLYIPFLKAVADSSPLYEYQLGQCILNRPGTPVGDIVMTSSDGSAVNLRESLGSSMTLLLFYDPDCDLCHETMAKVAAKPDVVSGKVKVIAVALTDDEALWRNDAAKLPDNWLKAIPAAGEDVESLFSIRGFPTILMIGADGNVIAKNVKIK